MYAVIEPANTRWPSDSDGVAHIHTRKPLIIGWRTWRYSERSMNGTGVYVRPRAYSQTWRRPNRSKWSVTNVEYTASAAPAACSAQIASRAGVAATVQIGSGSARHCQI